MTVNLTFNNTTMTDTHEEIIRRLLPLQEKNHSRFMAFYNQVCALCEELPEGQSFRISDKCNEKSKSLFRDIVALCIMEEPYDISKGELELSDDGETVRRTIGFKSSKKPINFIRKR